MSRLRVTFRCGHELPVSETATAAPVCACGETRIVDVQAPAPRFTGVGSGPLLHTANLEPAAVTLGSLLPLKGIDR